MQAVIACLLTSSVDLSASMRGNTRPLAPTHMRTQSIQPGDDMWTSGRAPLYPQQSGTSYAHSDSSYDEVAVLLLFTLSWLRL